MGDAGEYGRGRGETSGEVNPTFTQWLERHPRAKAVLLTIYYLAIITALVALYGRGNFETPEFVYAEF